MTWKTLEFGHTSAADAERPGRHSHAERRNDQCEGWHLYPIVPMLRVGMQPVTLRVTFESRRGA
ncbi:hypothetical protein PVFL_12085 [Pseudomonas viridiflava]|nr:hypothetical protein PVFL_12085 [Pseudomonas viridiflava]